MRDINELPFLRQGNSRGFMAKRSFKTRPAPRSKNKSARKSSKRTQIRLELKRLSDRIRNTIQSDAGHFDSLQGDEKVPERRKAGNFGRGTGMDHEEKGISGMVNPSIDPLKSLEVERGKIYGDPFLSHEAIGLAWEGIFRNRYHGLCLCDHKFGAHLATVGIPELSHPVVGQLFPADLVALMLAGFKVTRDARPVFHKDSGDDAKVYIDFARRFREGK